MLAPRPIRFFVALFDALAAVGVAAYGSALPLVRGGDLPLHLTASWGAVLAALLALVAVTFDLAILGWIAVGYLLWAGLLAGHALSLLFVALAISLAPVVPRPGGSLLQGVVVALGTAAVIAVVRRPYL